MCNVYERYRLRGDDTDAFCFLDVTIQWNADPSDIKISVNNNGIFYLTFDGNGTNPVYSPNQLVTEEEDLYYGPGVSLTLDSFFQQKGMPHLSTASNPHLLVISSFSLFQ
jgi:hypothetical protein